MKIEIIDKIYPIYKNKKLNISSLSRFTFKLFELIKEDFQKFKDIINYMKEIFLTNK